MVTQKTAPFCRDCRPRRSSIHEGFRKVNMRQDQHSFLRKHADTDHAKMEAIRAKVQEDLKRM